MSSVEGQPGSYSEPHLILYRNLIPMLKPRGLACTEGGGGGGGGGTHPRYVFRARRGSFLRPQHHDL